MKIEDAHKKLSGLDRIEYIIRRGHILEGFSFCVIIQWLAFISGIMFLLFDYYILGFAMSSFSVVMYLIAIVYSDWAKKKLNEEFFSINTKKR